ncbi:hypothetical protein vseg_001824 [Gypsophila vaccaria]
MKIVNFPTCSISPKTVTKTPHILFSFTNNNVFTLKLGNRSLAHFFTQCSTKPTTHIDNTEDTILNNPPKGQPNYVSKQPSSSALTSSSEGLVFDLGQSGSWDCIEVGSPVVKRFLSDEEERWFMWYHGRSEKNLGAVGLAVSSNGVHWQRGESSSDSSSGTGMVLSCAADWWAFDTKSIRPAEVMIMSSDKVRFSSAVYWMYYTGFCSEKVELPRDSAEQYSLCNPESLQLDSENGVITVFRTLPGLAISQDGRNWARIEGDHHSGALFDVGSHGEWDSLFIASPHVVFHANGDLRMYYHSFDPEIGKFAIGLARSRDGIKWLKLRQVLNGGLTDGCFDEMGVINACVVREKKDGKYLMAYEGIAKDGKKSIGLAVSDDGLRDWRRVGDHPVLQASSENSWDSKGVGSPCLVQMEGDEHQWRLYYNGVGLDGRTGIGFAVSQGNGITCFRRWVGFHL